MEVKLRIIHSVTKLVLVIALLYLGALLFIYFLNNIKTVASILVILAVFHND